MNYGEKLKTQETKLIQLKATIMAKKQSLAAAIEEKKKVEIEVKTKFNVELSDLPNYKAQLEQELKELCSQTEEEIQKIENELDTINS